MPRPLGWRSEGMDLVAMAGESDGLPFGVAVLFPGKTDPEMAAAKETLAKLLRYADSQSDPSVWVVMGKGVICAFISGISLPMYFETTRSMPPMVKAGTIGANSFFGLLGGLEFIAYVDEQLLVPGSLVGVVERGERIGVALVNGVLSLVAAIPLFFTTLNSAKTNGLPKALSTGVGNGLLNLMAMRALTEAVSPVLRVLTQGGLDAVRRRLFGYSLRRMELIALRRDRRRMLGRFRHNLTMRMAGKVKRQLGLLRGSEQMRAALWRDGRFRGAFGHLDDMLALLERLAALEVEFFPNSVLLQGVGSTVSTASENRVLLALPADDDSYEEDEDAEFEADEVRTSIYGLLWQQLKYIAGLVADAFDSRVFGYTLISIITVLVTFASLGYYTSSEEEGLSYRDSLQDVIFLYGLLRGLIWFGDLLSNILVGIVVTGNGMRGAFQVVASALRGQMPSSIFYNPTLLAGWLMSSTGVLFLTWNSYGSALGALNNQLSDGLLVNVSPEFADFLRNVTMWMTRACNSSAALGVNASVWSGLQRLASKSIAAFLAERLRGCETTHSLEANRDQYDSRAARLIDRVRDAFELDAEIYGRYDAVLRAFLAKFALLSLDKFQEVIAPMSEQAVEAIFGVSKTELLRRHREFTDLDNQIQVLEHEVAAERSEPGGCSLLRSGSRLFGCCQGGGGEAAEQRRKQPHWHRSRSHRVLPVGVGGDDDDPLLVLGEEDFEAAGGRAYSPTGSY